MTRVVWSNKVGGLPRVDNARSVPKRPVIWRGEVWLRMPNGERHARSWKSHNRITRQQAQEVMQIMLADLIEECGQDAAVDSGFTMECR